MVADKNFDRLTFWVRVVSVIMAATLLITDYGFDLWRKDPPVWIYMLLVGLALGVEAKAFRHVALAAIAKFAEKIK